MRHFAIMTTLTLSACAPSGYVYEVGNFVRPHPTQALCASRGQVLDMAIEDCAAPASPPASASVIAAAAFSNQGETYEQDRAWTDRIEHGACTRLRDRRTDSPADIAECNRDYAMQPPCMSYKGFASVWYDMADNPVPGGVSTVAFQTDVINNLGPTKANPNTPSYEQAPQFRDMLHRLLNVALSSNRKKWGTRDQFADYAYKICMERHPF